MSDDFLPGSATRRRRPLFWGFGVEPPGAAAQRQFSATATPPPTPVCRITHVVQRGENLFRISMHYNVNMWTVAQANSIANVRLIVTGQTLCIP